MQGALRLSELWFSAAGFLAVLPVWHVRCTLETESVGALAPQPFQAQRGGGGYPALTQWSPHRLHWHPQSSCSERLTEGNSTLWKVAL